MDKKKQKQRTKKQNDALHLSFEILAELLNDAGLDMRIVLKPGINIPWDKKSVKKYLWHPLQKAMLEKKSTTELDKIGDIDKVYKVLLRELGEKHGFEYVDFPSVETIMKKKGWDKT